jgi:U2 small nuclear ribonucleoprotein A'
MVRLTAELILSSPQYINPLKERELDLRGNKIATIENLGCTEVFQYFSFPFNNLEPIRFN